MGEKFQLLQLGEEEKSICNMIFLVGTHSVLRTATSSRGDGIGRISIYLSNNKSYYPSCKAQYI